MNERASETREACVVVARVSCSCGRARIRLEGDRLGLEHSEWHRDQHRVALEALAAAARVHAHAVGRVLDGRHLALEQNLQVAR